MPIHIHRFACDRTEPCLRIGLVNNMPASLASEHQFISLLERASGEMEVSLSLYTLPGLAESSLDRRCQSMETLYAFPPKAALDALLVTGREPVAADLRDELYWASFVTLVEWARSHTISTVWSCLAAHAAVLHLDGIVRRRSAEKHCGVFPCCQPLSASAAHPLSTQASSRWYVPHSRWNGLAERDLRDAGYSLLTLTTDGEVDAFTKPNASPDESLFVFFQGHPEYGTDTLLREYRRDVGRYLAGLSQSYPSLPVHYFDGRTEAALSALRNRAASGNMDGLQTALAGVLDTARIVNSWTEPAVNMYKQWLQFLIAEKARRCAGSYESAFAAEPVFT